MAFEHDMIGREGVVEDLMKTIRLVHDTQHGFTLCLNGGWGCGKTYILKELEERLKAETGEANLRVAGANKYLVLHYNCWQYDYYEEPLTAIISVFQEEIDRIMDPISPSTYAKADEILAEVAKLIGAVMFQLTTKQLHLPEDFADRLDKLKNTKADISKLLELFAGNKSVYVDQLAPFSAAIQKTRRALDMITNKYGYTVVLVVDELDRCLPSYAIKVLERLHHLFDQRKNCAVILALDKPQLSHAIRTCFGPRTDVNVYLKKFIHYTYNLYDKRSRRGIFMEKYASYFNLFSVSPEEYPYICDYLISLFAYLDMRTQELLFTQAEMLHRFRFPNLHGAPAELLLVEITATVFSHYEITHARECKWGRLMRFPFELVEIGDPCGGHNPTARLKPIYEDMHSLEIHIRRNWTNLELKNGKWTFSASDAFPKMLAKTFCESLDGRGVEIPNLNLGNTALRREMTDFVKALRQCW